MSDTNLLEGARGSLRSPRAAGVAGLIFSALFITTLLLTMPLEGATGQSVARWASGQDRSTVVFIGLYAIPFAGIAFLWFIGVVRDRIGRREDRLFATVFLGSGLLFVAMLFAGAAVGTAVALRVNDTGVTAPVDPAVLQFTQALTAAFLFVYAARAAGVFMWVTSTIAMRTRAVPRWVAIIGYAIALALLLSVRHFQWVLALFPLWVALLSIFILVTPRPGDVDEELPE